MLAKNFGVPEQAFAGIPDKELFIFQSKVPGPLADDRVAGAGPPPQSYSHRLLDQKPIRSKGGTVRMTHDARGAFSADVQAALRADSRLLPPSASS